jgi:hypothetical protein
VDRNTDKFITRPYTEKDPPIFLTNTDYYFNQEKAAFEGIDEEELEKISDSEVGASANS